LTFLALMIEGAVIDWAAIYLNTERGIATASAGIGLAAFMGAMAAARFTGDKLRTMFGAALIVRASSIGAACGLLLVALAPSFWVILVGFSLAGLGIGNIAPILFAAGGRLDPIMPARSIAAITTMGYSGFLVGPPVIGVIAGSLGFTYAFLLLACLSIFSAIIAIRLIRPHLG
jgi:MFS family permease